MEYGKRGIYIDHKDNNIKPQITGFLAGDSDLRSVAVNSLAGYLHCHYYYNTNFRLCKPKITKFQFFFGGWGKVRI